MYCPFELQIIELLQEYLNSGDVKEAERCLRDLDVPHFHHELVYEAAVIAIEESTDRAVTMMAQLLTAFNISNVVTPTCFVKVINTFIKITFYIGVSRSQALLNHFLISCDMKRKCVPINVFINIFIIQPFS